MRRGRYEEKRRSLKTWCMRMLFCCSYNFTRVATCFRVSANNHMNPFLKIWRWTQTAPTGFDVIIDFEIPQSAVDFEADPKDPVGYHSLWHPVWCSGWFHRAWRKSNEVDVELFWFYTLAPAEWMCKLFARLQPLKWRPFRESWHLVTTWQICVYGATQTE